MILWKALWPHFIKWPPPLSQLIRKMYLFLDLSYSLIVNLSANPPDSSFEIFSESKCFLGNPFNTITLTPASNFLHLDKYDSLLTAVSPASLPLCCQCSLQQLQSDSSQTIPSQPSENQSTNHGLPGSQWSWPQLLHWMYFLPCLLSPTLSRNSLLAILKTASRFPFRAFALVLSFWNVLPQILTGLISWFFHLISFTLHLVFTLLKKAFVGIL